MLAGWKKASKLWSLRYDLQKHSVFIVNLSKNCMYWKFRKVSSTIVNSHYLEFQQRLWMNTVHGAVFTKISIKEIEIWCNTLVHSEYLAFQQCPALWRQPLWMNLRRSLTLLHPWWPLRSLDYSPNSGPSRNSIFEILLGYRDPHIWKCKKVCKICCKIENLSIQTVLRIHRVGDD